MKLLEIINQVIVESSLSRIWKHITDFPTTYIYQGYDDIREWLRIL